MDPVRQIADAVLYEGYVLWPYRKSAMKNQQRWTFGGVYPEAHSARRGGVDDPCRMQTQVLVEGDEQTTLDVTVRFLHVVERQILETDAQGRLAPVEELVLGEERHLSWDEATEREIAVGARSLGELLEGPIRTEISIPAAIRHEDLEDPAGRRAGAVARSWRTLEGSVEVAAERLEPRLFRLTARIANMSPWSEGGREDALRQTFCSTHTVLRAQNGEFVSLTDPPEPRTAAARDCQNEGTWPVLVGEEGERGTLLSSAMILPDHPQIAPESPGDLFDGGEIDQMLVLNILTMTDEERRDMRDADPKTREILERTEALTPEQLMRLHGAVREFGMAR